MLMFSSFVPNIFMGAIAVLVILFALIGDLVLLPALIPPRNSMSEEIKSDISNTDKDLVVGN